MAIAQEAVSPQLLTYEQYMAEGEINKRYDIIDGVRALMPGPKWGHQRIQRRLLVLSAPCEEASGQFQTAGAPMDILIRPNPLRTRQPDVLFISKDRLEQGNVDMETGFLPVAPEVVVEILSPSDTPQALEDKITDYRSVDVRECWVVRTATRVVDVLRLTPAGRELVATYNVGDTVHSFTFPELVVPVAAIFAE